MEGGYLYQTIHTVGYSPLYLDEHCRLLEDAFMTLYFRALHLDREDIKSDIYNLLDGDELTRELSIFVDLRVDLRGEYTLSVDHLSIYDGYTLRCTSPRAVLVDFNSPFGALPTCARRSTVMMANSIAVNLGGDLAVEVNTREGVDLLCTVGGAATFMVVGRKLVTPTLFESVERSVVMEAARGCGIEVEQREIDINELMSCDELLIADHYGVTAVSNFEHRPYANTIATKIANMLSQPF